MPKPNKKRVEERTEADLRAKGAGKLYIPDNISTGTIRAEDIKAQSIPLARITDDELERELTKMLSGQQGFGKNFRNAQKSRQKKEK